MCFLIPYAYGITSFHYLPVLVSYFSAIFRSRCGRVYVFPSLSLISKFSRWLSERVSNALVRLLTLRLPSPGWVSMLLFSFLSAILIVVLPPKGWQPFPQCVSEAHRSFFLVQMWTLTCVLNPTLNLTDSRDLPRPFPGVLILSFGVRF